MPATVGMRFGRYELLDKLGAGGMGEVYRARDHDLHRDVAVKFLPEPFVVIPARLGPFAQEARAASSLNHPNIVTIHEIGEAGGLPFIVMELVHGETLRDLIRNEHHMPARRVLDERGPALPPRERGPDAGRDHRDRAGAAEALRLPRAGPLDSRALPGQGADRPLRFDVRPRP
jgi:hypothetical protein